LCVPAVCFVMDSQNGFPIPSGACICGRDASRVHCPRCGIFTVYARSAKRNTWKTRANGDLVSVQTFQCRRCGLLFDDDEWRTGCRAPFKAAPAETPAYTISRSHSATQSKLAETDLQSDPGAPDMLREAAIKVMRMRDPNYKWPGSK
jgi:hypothetical protein